MEDGSPELLCAGALCCEVPEHGLGRVYSMDQLCNVDKIFKLVRAPPITAFR